MLKKKRRMFFRMNKQKLPYYGDLWESTEDKILLTAIWHINVDYPSKAFNLCLKHLQMMTWPFFCI